MTTGNRRYLRDADIQGGSAVFRGARVNVWILFNYLAGRRTSTIFSARTATSRGRRSSTPCPGRRQRRAGRPGQPRRVTPAQPPGCLVDESLDLSLVEPLTAARNDLVGLQRCSSVITQSE